MYAYLLVAVLAAAAALVRCADVDELVPISDVVPLVASNYTWINEQPLALVQYFTDNCGPCDELVPHYEITAIALKKQGIPTARFNCTAAPAVCAEAGITAVPSLQVARFGRLTELDVYPDVQRIIQHMSREAQPLLTHIADAAALREFAARDEFVLVGLVGDDDTASLSALTEYATVRRGHVLVGRGSAALARELGAPVPSALVLRTFDTPTAVHQPGESLTAPGLDAFVRGERVPLWREFDVSAQDHGLPLALYYTAQQGAEHESEMAALRAATQHLRSHMAFAWINATTGGDSAELLNLEAGQWPALAIVADGGRNKYTLQANVSPAAVAQFCAAFLHGELAATVRSAPPPAQQGVVKEVVASEFDAMVFADRVDVLLVLYHPDSAACRALDPKLESLAREYETKAAPVRIAKFDVSANDMPAHVGIDAEGMPAIVLKTGRDTLVPYAGALSEAALRHFIDEKRTNYIIHDEL